tara:strand:+ start:3343 stop:4365 length:1023 start_codon:yes stop_codon:yes gene_type:complete
MADNYANPLKEAETDIGKATRAITGLLNPKKEDEVETPQEEQQQNSPESTNEESETDQPQTEENQETESEEEEVSEVASQEQEQTEIQEKPDSTFKVKVAGQELDVTLDELKNGYSRDADYRRKTEELSFERKELQSQSEKQRQDYSTKLNELNQLMSVAQEQLNADVNSADLEKLYEEDPTEAARIDHRLRKKQEKLSSAMQKIQSERNQQLESYKKEQAKILISKMPEFSDQAKAYKLATGMKDTLYSYGFNAQEINDVFDHRIVMLVNDAMNYRNMQKAKPNIAKKITKPGKVFSSGVKQTKADVTFKARKDRLSRLKKSGSMKDATSVFLDMINNK